MLKQVIVLTLILCYSATLAASGRRAPPSMSPSPITNPETPPSSEEIRDVIVRITDILEERRLLTTMLEYCRYHGWLVPYNPHNLNDYQVLCDTLAEQPERLRSIPPRNAQISSLLRACDTAHAYAQPFLARVGLFLLIAPLADIHERPFGD